MSLSVSLAYAPLSQAADSIPSEHKEFFEQAFGYVPDNAEYTSNLEQFGSVPTDEEIALYLDSSNAEEQALKTQLLDQSMRKQFFCHARYGMIKVPWNLEPSRRPNSVNPVTCN
ncbi:DUF2599 domain-containing protein [Propionimicrobium lymphophilum]|uniref:DUF2599 domain-containing protein n=1 Tax=Propionimicrobium lymphophilum TaxID=33012 RepID=UPI00288956B0|nr:DUF2599 domain-containing protein [Propionimicrobium lymphophilum]